MMCLVVTVACFRPYSCFWQYGCCRPKHDVVLVFPVPHEQVQIPEPKPLASCTSHTGFTCALHLTKWAHKSIAFSLVQLVDPPIALIMIQLD